MSKINVHPAAVHRTQRLASAIIILLVVTTLAILTNTPLKSETTRPLVDNQQRIALPSKLSCINLFHGLETEEQLNCLQKIEQAGISNVSFNAHLEQLLESSDRDTDHRVIAGLLDLVRDQGKDARELAEIVSQLLPHQAEIYQGRDKWYVLRLRAYTFITLSEIGFPESALPMLVDALAYVDERMNAVEFGAAIRVVGTLGERGQQFIPFLLNTLGERFAEEEFSLNRYEVVFPREEATTVQIEVVRSLAAVCTGEDDQALTVLRTIANSHEHSTLDMRLIKEARRALQTIEARLESDKSLGLVDQIFGLFDNNKLKTNRVAEEQFYVTPWLGPRERHRLQNLDIVLEDQDGREYILSQFIDRPVLFTFFYTRCQNAGKCSATIARLAMLQQELSERGMASDVRLLAITFEPEYDTPMRLKRYTIDHGLELGDYSHAVRLQNEGHTALIEELDTPVGYSSGWVNTHGVEAVLLDAEGRLARKYNTLGWNPAVILDDFQHLLAEQ